MKKIIVKLLLSALILFTPVSYAYAHTAEIAILSEKTEYISVPLNTQIYNNCRPDFGDIRIYDSDGNILPYFIQSLTPDSDSEINENVYPMQNSDRFIKDGCLYLDYKLAQYYPNDIRASSLKLKTDSYNFAESARLYGGYDGLEWTFLQEENLYSVKDAQNMSFNFSKPQKYTYYRIVLPNRSENPNFTDAFLYFREEIQEDLRITSMIDAEFLQENTGQTTVIRLPSLKNMQIEYIAIETDDMFKRDVSYPGGTQTLQRLTFGNEIISDAVLHLNGIKIPEDFSFTIYNGDNAPLDIKGIKASYYENYLIFKSSKAPYKVTFGDIDLTKPVYDIENYKGEVLRQPLAAAEFSDIIFNEIISEQNNTNTQLIFNIAVCAAAAVLIIMIVSALAKNKK